MYSTALIARSVRLVLGIVYPFREQAAARLDKQPRHEFYGAPTEVEHLFGGYSEFIETGFFCICDRRTEIDRVDAGPMKRRHAHGAGLASRRNRGAG